MDEQIISSIAGLSETDRQEIGSVLERHQQQAQVSRMVHSLSQICFKKCITGKITSDTLSSSEQSCAANCVGRWLDTQTSIVKSLGTLQTAQAKSGGLFG